MSLVPGHDTTLGHCTATALVPGGSTVRAGENVGQIDPTGLGHDHVIGPGRG